MLSLILLKKILSLYIVLLIGFITVKLGLLKSEDNKTLSVFLVYVISPVNILSAFQMDKTPEKLNGMLLSLIGAGIVCTMFIIIARLLCRPLRLTPEEEISMSFPNVGNLIVPLVMSVFGSEWVVYSLGYIIVQTCYIWTYSKIRISRDKHVDIKKIILNPNILAIIVSFILFIFDIKLPEIAADAVDSVSASIGPLGMLMTGMILAGMDIKAAFMNGRVWLTALFRLILFPAIAVAVLRLSGLAAMNPNGTTILTITLMGASSPAMACVMQLASFYGKDVDHACAINVLTTILCVITMPLMIGLFRM